MPDRRLGRWLDREIELGREAHRAQHAHRILPIAGLRIADQFQAARPHIADAVDEIPNRKVVDVVVETVGREIAPPHVLFDGAVDVVAQDAPPLIEGAVLGIVRRSELGARASAGGVGHCRLLIVRIRFAVLRVLPLRRRRRAESRHLDDLLAEMHVRQAKAPADEAAIAKQAPHLFGQGIGRHVEVLRGDAEQQVADRPADQKPLITRLFEAVEDFQGVRRDRRTRNRMLGARDDQRGEWRRRCVQKGGFRLSPKNWPVYYQPSWVQAPRIRKQRSLRLEA